ncbi:hypothetical protein ACT17Q_00590 [Cellulomonas sp. CW35]|uniref:hypothetical protein n=1 Tax=Cellulomonas sp. CW35 TaxID=3458249 RepID=UPI00403374A8
MTYQCTMTDLLVGQLKQSAIDVWMREQGWRLYGDHYENGSRGSVAKVTRPNTDGSGGGDWSADALSTLFGRVDRDEFFIAQFDAVRRTIDEIVAPWLALPSPASIAPLVEECRQTTRRLSGAARIEDGEVTGGGELTVHVSLVSQNLTAMSGTLIASLKAKFLGQLARAIGGMHAISVVRGIDVAAQQALWAEAQTAFEDILVTARTALDAIAHGRGPEWNDALQAAAWVAKGAGIFATGGVSAALEVGGIAIDVLSATAAPSPSPEVKAPTSYAGAIASLRSELSRLSDRIESEERLVARNAARNVTQITQDRTSYDLSQPAVYDLEPAMVLNASLLEEIYAVYMPEIATELDAVAGGVPISSALRRAVARDATIGLGAHGPSDNVAELTQLLYNLLRDLAWEVRSGARNLELAIASIEERDAQVAEELRRIVKRIDAGSPYAPWG